MSIAEQLPKQYDPQDAQARWYAFWVDRGYFHADPSRDAPPYTIVIPPPNVTGALHLGHALNNTLQDILIRWRRMQGYDTLWMPGTDHAGIATQAVVEKRLFTEEKKTRHDIGREALVNRIWAWKHEYEARILGQLRLMGCSCDWDRTRFTLDDMCARAVRVTFFNLFKDGKIFRGKRLVNWDTQLRTAVADDEIEYKETEGYLWTIRYPVTGSDSEFLQVSTTRPETMLGDTAVAVHPADERYAHLIGKTVDLPLTGMRIPIIADPILVDPRFGTGCVKVTPAHDPNDYQTGLRHGLPMVNLLNPDGTYNENANAYAGLDRREVRKRVVADLEAQGLLVKVEPYTNRVGYSDRSKTPIEPYLSDQWFVRMGDDEDGSPGFAQQAMDAVTSGRLKIHPERYAKSYLDWLGEKRDWCISRQLWWGHRIPIWHCDACPESELRRAFAGRDDVSWRESESGGWLICALNDLGPDLFPGHALIALEQAPDVLDTWFSSALWPHSTLGWPEKTPELAKYYPTSVLSTARDIITLWVARMVIFGQFNMGEVPFKDVYIHPVIQDGDGKRMSKSAGNGVDPVDIIELYGADALRFTLASSATETQDLRMPVEPTTLPDGRSVNSSKKFEEGRTFPNKFWNASRFAMINLEGYDPEFLPGDFQGTGPVDLWILGGLARTTREVTRAFESFQFAEAAKILRDFTWNDFCDWYVELAKRPLRSEDAITRQTTQHVLITALDTLCRLLHPIIPFVTEQVWQSLNQIAPRRKNPVTMVAEVAAESVCIAPWPTFPDRWGWPDSDRWVAQLQEKVSALRNLRADRNVPASAKIAPTIIASGDTATILGAFTTDIMALTGAESFRIVESFEKPSNAAVAVLPDAEIVLPMEGLIDPKVEIEKLAKSKLDLEKQLGGVKAKLGNASFVDRAPAEVVQQQRDRLLELEAQYAAVSSRLAELGG
jgi:valyl-tRNA synthetase